MIPVRHRYGYLRSRNSSSLRYWRLLTQASPVSALIDTGLSSCKKVSFSTRPLKLDLFDIFFARTYSTSSTSRLILGDKVAAKLKPY